jgi:hypothetical protein
VVKMPIILGKGRDPQHLKFTVISMAGSLDGLPKKNGALLKGRPGMLKTIVQSKLVCTWNRIP